MSDVKRLLEQATPLPWPEDYGQAIGDDINDPDDAALAVYAVNRLPDYEAAVEALERFVESHEAGYPASIVLSSEACDAAREAIHRLRESVPA